MSDEPRYLNRTGMLAHAEERAFICVPVKAGRRTIGAVSALTKPKDNPDLGALCDCPCFEAVRYKRDRE